MLKSKITGVVQEVVLPDFPDDDNTVTTTVTKSRRVSFGTNFVKEFIVGSAVSAQCMSEYEQAFPSSDSSNADSSQSAADILEQCKFPENVKVHKAAPTVSQSVEAESSENRPKPPKFSRTICFSADSPTADMEFTEGCITLAKSILEKKNKEMTVIIQAVPKETKEEEKPKDETKYFDGSQFEMSMTKCLKSKENRREEKRFESEKTKIFSKFEDEMSITRCNKIFTDDDSDSWSNCKENVMPLDMIMHHLDKDNSDFENELFNPKKSFNNFLNANPFDLSNESEKLNLNESMDISADFHPNIFNESQKITQPDDKLNESKSVGSDNSEKISNDLMEISGELQPDLSKIEENPPEKAEESKKICSDIHETSQNSVKSDEAVDFARIDKSDEIPEEVFPNVAGENISDDHHVDVSLDISLQSKNVAIDDKLMDSEKNCEVSSVESMEICGGLETKSVQLPENVNLSFFGEEICNNKLMVNSFEKESVSGSVNVNVSFQADIPKDSEDLHLQSDPNDDNELLKNEKMVEDLKSNDDIQFNVVEASEQTVSSREICNDEAGVNVSEKPNNETPPEVLEEYETLPVMSQKDSDKTTEIVVSEETNTSMKCITDCQPQNDEKIVSEEECNQFGILDDDEAMEISMAETDISAVSEKCLPDEEIVDEVQINDLEKHNLENVTEDNHSNSLEMVENPPPTEGVVVDNSCEPPLNKQNESSAHIADNVPENRQISQNPSEDRVRKSGEFNSSNDTTEVPTWTKEPSLVDIKVIESLREQSKEPGCIWSLKDLRYPQGKISGFVSFTCELLESTTTICFSLEASYDDRLDSCSNVKDSEINLNEEKLCRLPEYGLVIGFGFQELKKFFDERRRNVETIRLIPYFLDQINSFLFKMNSYLRQIHSILTLYPGSRLEDSKISFRLYSFPVFFSCVVSIDLTDLFRLSKSSLSFENDFGSLDENKIRDIFQNCLKSDNSLCEFVVQSTNYLFDIEKKSGYVSKRRHIRLLPVELKL